MFSKRASSLRVLLPIILFSQFPFLSSSHAAQSISPAETGMLGTLPLPNQEEVGAGAPWDGVSVSAPKHLAAADSRTKFTDRKFSSPSNPLFSSAVSYLSGGEYADSVAVGDVNGDGKPDLLVANGCADRNCTSGSVGVLLGNGDGTFQTAVSYGSGGVNAISPAVGDVNGDGKPDLLVANECADINCTSGSVGVLLGNGDGTFQRAVIYASGGYYTDSLAMGDVNGDGKPDLLVADYCTSSRNCANASVGVLINISQPTVTLSPTSLNFGNQTVGITSSPQVSTLTNTGNGTLTIMSIGITGTNSSDFAQTNNCPGSVSPNGSCQISVTFTPSATGTRDAAVSVTDNAPNSPQSLPLTGVGVLPAVTFSPTSLTFRDQVVFTSSPTKSVTLTNTGLGVLLISKISVIGLFSQTNDCPSSVGPGANCTIRIKFHPQNKGVQHGSVNVTDNAPGSPQKVPLTGIGTYVQLLPRKVNFGTQSVGTRSLPKTITLTNKGDGPVNIQNISVTGLDAGDFAEKNNCGKRVLSGASCFIKVTFKPLVKGKRTAEISVRDDGGGSPQTVALSGTGT